MTITALSDLGVLEGPSIEPPLCRETPVSRTAVRLFIVVFPSSLRFHIHMLVHPLDSAQPANTTTRARIFRRRTLRRGTVRHKKKC